LKTNIYKHIFYLEREREGGEGERDKKDK